MQCLFSAIYFGRANPKKNENPMMNRFREEFRSTNWRFEIPTAVIMPGTRTDRLSGDVCTYSLCFIMARFIMEVVCSVRYILTGNLLNQLYFVPICSGGWEHANVKQKCQ